MESVSRYALTADPVPDRKPPGVGSIETPPQARFAVCCTAPSLYTLL
nr:MAG TPA: hypothetical protein [Caudoviricetes sp.]